MKKSHELVKEVMTDLNEMEGILQGFPKANEALKAIIGGMRNTLGELAKLKGLPENTVGVDSSRTHSKAPQTIEERREELRRRP